MSNPEADIDLHRRVEILESILLTNSREISQSSINLFIDDILNDPETNTFIPDSIERAFYKKIIGVTLKALEKTISNAKISILNHNITFDLKACDETDSENLNRNDNAY